MAPTLDATALHRDARVWDMILPYDDIGKLALKRTALDRMTRAGYNVVSLTLASNNRDLATTVRLIARERQFFVGKPERYQLVDTAADIRAAKPFRLDMATVRSPICRRGNAAAGYRADGKARLQGRGD